MTTSVDQQTQRRRGVGLIAHDRERAFQGYTLFTPQFRGGPPLLVDMEGKIVHEWRTPLPVGCASLLPNGNLLALGRTPESGRSFRAWHLVRAGVVIELDWEGNVLWEVRHPDHHHDARLTRNGNVLMLCVDEVPLTSLPRFAAGCPEPSTKGQCTRTRSSR